ncbi:STAS/SEC14 domain-containing protein [Chitinivorax sp. B]|uniref:STAS/SEC14 domain-containing protein n=1 Tax=Chitinivorax sp. B TaxID=2502235 RepID=UPI0010F73B2D|nr:STAS/SEC14 domain-containing protein [Chitinivorax sp. B]
MITIKQQGNTVNVAVFGEFMLADYKQFEDDVLYAIKFHGKPNLLLDLRDMTGYTLDMAWEEIKFTRTHAADFGKIAVVTNDQWVAWSAWVSRLFINIDVQLFDTIEAAEGWATE